MYSSSFAPPAHPGLWPGGATKEAESPARLPSKNVSCLQKILMGKYWTFPNEKDHLFQQRVSETRLIDYVCFVIKWREWILVFGISPRLGGSRKWEGTVVCGMVCVDP